MSDLGEMFGDFEDLGDLFGDMGDMEDLGDIFGDMFGEGGDFSDFGDWDFNYEVASLKDYLAMFDSTGTCAHKQTSDGFEITITFTMTPKLEEAIEAELAHYEDAPEDVEPMPFYLQTLDDTL